MSEKENNGKHSFTSPDFSPRKRGDEIYHYCKVYKYPCGIHDVICSSSPVFKEDGWEEDTRVPQKPDTKPQKPQQGEKPPPDAESVLRSIRRAKAKVRRIALSNHFRWFVTLTLDPAKIDRYDPAAVVRKMSQWCNNQVKRRGLAYILIPEHHKDGAIHFHGFFNDALPAVASGHKDGSGHMIYNLPGWTLGFTAAIQTYGDYAGAVAYVCKYIGKELDAQPAQGGKTQLTPAEKIGGRWYYSGGQLASPAVDYCEIAPAELVEVYGDRAFVFDVEGVARFAVCNGLKIDKEDNHGGNETEPGSHILPGLAGYGGGV